MSGDPLSPGGVRPVRGTARALLRTAADRYRSLTVITQCCIKALYDAGPSAQAATDIAKTFERRKCNHLDKPKTEDECMKTMAGQ